MTLLIQTTLLRSIGALSRSGLFKQVGLLATVILPGGVYTADTTLYTADTTLLTADLT